MRHHGVVSSGLRRHVVDCKIGICVHVFHSSSRFHNYHPSTTLFEEVATIKGLSPRWQDVVVVAEVVVGQGSYEELWRKLAEEVYLLVHRVRGLTV